MEAFKIGRAPFQGSRVLAYNQLTKDLIEESGLCQSNQVEIFGMARIDHLHNWRRTMAKREPPLGGRLGVFFTQPTAQLPTMIADAGVKAFVNEAVGLRWNKLVALTNQTIYKIAKDNPAIEVIVKAKHTDLDMARTIYGQWGSAPPNLKITDGIKALDLIACSDAICAFNSTSVLETIAAGVPVILPHFGGALEPRYSRYLLDFGGVPQVADSPAALESQLLEHFRLAKMISRDLSDEARDVLAYGTNNPDGNLGSAMFRKVADLLEERIS